MNGDAIGVCSQVKIIPRTSDITFSLGERNDFLIIYSQMFPMALVCGNTMVIKPSPRNPLSVMFIMKLAQDAGVPDGCLNVFHGTVERNASILSSVV